MTKIMVQSSLRKKRRDLKDTLGDDILRYIAELITNSDDSYRRLESDGNISEKNDIYIELSSDRRKKEAEDDNYVIRVIDNAEGMTEENLIKIFETYGADNAGGVRKKARGIFGQGASDVLQSSASEKRTALIETIKDNRASRLTYNMDENLDPSIDVTPIENLSNNQLSQLRNNWNIPENGTSISFGIPSTVKFNKRIKDNMKELISMYPSFRYLLNQSNRNIYYICDNKKEKLSSEKYQFNDERLLAEKSFNFKFDNNRIECILKVYENENKKYDGTNILVIDENYSVFDNTMFDFQNAASAQNISGELLIKGLYDICYEHLNAENPDAIVRDNRTGFDVKNDFYKELNKAINPILEKILDENSKDVKTTNLTNNKKFNDALKKLNKYIKAELKDEIGGNLKGTTPPVEGIKFIRQSASITKGKTYNLKLLINSEIVDPNKVIDIVCEDNPKIDVQPKKITYNIDEVEDNLVIKNIIIKANECTEEPILVQAKVDSRISSIAIDVLDLDIHYPENGLEFYPNDVALVYDKTHYIKLYIDTSIVPLGSTISISCFGLDGKVSYLLDDSNIIAEGIIELNVEFSGGELGKTYDVKANFNEIVTNAKITLIESGVLDPPGNGLISGFKLEPSEMAFQSYFNPYTHQIVINSQNPINIRIMGDMKDKNPEKPIFSKEQSKYLCDIISNQAAALLVKHKNIKHGEVNFDDFGEAVENIQNLMQEHKNNIYSDMYSVIVDVSHE